MDLPPKALPLQPWKGSRPCAWGGETGWGKGKRGRKNQEKQVRLPRGIFPISICSFTRIVLP
jgi:hypothetical protein